MRWRRPLRGPTSSLQARGEGDPFQEALRLDLAEAPPTDSRARPGGFLGQRATTTLLLGSLWIVAAVALSELSVRVKDWFDADEILYERLALGIARTHSLVPHIHGVSVHSYAQLYPLLVAPLFRNGLVPGDLASAQMLNAWLMSSACVPAFLLARRVTGRQWTAYAAAVLAICMPWIFYSSMLMTEVVAFPVFLWTMLALQRATVAPSWRNDLAVAVTTALAGGARTELIVLVAVVPLAIAAYELGRRTRRPRDVVRTHALLAAVYLLLAATALALAVTGRISSVAGLYSNYAAHSGLLPNGFFGALAEHVATFSLAFAVLPLVVGVAWLLANLVRSPADEELHAFACVGSITIAVILLQATHFDVQEVGYVYDRYLVYLAPLVVLSALCAALDTRAPRWSLLVPATLVVCGFAFGAIPQATWGQFPTVLPDAPLSSLYRPLTHAFGGLTGARIALGLATVLGTGLALAGSRRLGLIRPAALLVALLAVALPSTTAYVLVRYFGANDWSQRPLTDPQAHNLDWVDTTLGPTARVTMAPSPVSSDWFVSQRVWRDYEFWNKSTVRTVATPGVFDYTGSHFPKMPLAFDPRTGAANASPTPYVLESDQESRFRISGTAVADTDGVRLIDAGQTWRTDWLSFGLYDDGWTRPGVTARVRVYSSPGQTGPVVRTITFGVRAPDGVAARPFEIVSNLAAVHGQATPGNSSFETMQVCVPPSGFAVLRLSTPDSSPIPGDQRSLGDSLASRTGGVQVSEIGLSDDVGGSCTS